MHTNKTNKKVYIGITCQTVQERWQNGLGYKKDQPVFYNAIQKYGWDGFEHIIFAENVTADEAVHMEILLIALYKTNCKKYRNPERGYNMTDGGGGMAGVKHSDEAKQKMSQRAKERFANPENHPNYGWHPSEESRKRMSEAQKGKNVGSKNPFYGKHHSDETVNKLKEAHADISKAVIQLTKNGEIVNIFSSIHEASKQTGITRTGISFCVRDLQQTAGGYKWRLLETIQND
jgi:group I intron endonuclease